MILNLLLLDQYHLHWCRPRLHHSGLQLQSHFVKQCPIAVRMLLTFLRRRESIGMATILNWLRSEAFAFDGGELLYNGEGGRRRGHPR